MRRKAFSLTELLIISAVIVILAGILFPVFKQAAASQVTNKPNLKKIAQAAAQYGQDFDDRMPIFMNGPYRDLKNVDDGTLTQYNESRTDGWDLILLPYVKDRTTYIDPRRDDIWHIWSGPALATSDAGYTSTGNTFRNQSRFPYFGVNYMFLSAIYIPSSHMTDTTPTDYLVSESHSFAEADRPAKTIFYNVSDRGWVPTDFTDTTGTQDTTRGFWALDPPGMWKLAATSTSPYVLFWNGTNCSGDWCGDTTPTTNPDFRTENFNYIEPTLGGNNVAYLDGHVGFLSDVQMAAGTNYLTATPQDFGTGYFGGGAVVTDKSRYIWNLNGNFYGLY